MKKIFSRISIFLVCTLLFSYSVAAEEKGKSNTFYGFTYCDPYDFDNIVKPVNINKEMVDASGFAGVAKKAKTQLDALPEGRRCVDIVKLINETFETGQTNYFFGGENVKNTKELVDGIFSQLKKEGAQVDFVVDDYEGSYTLYQFENEAIAYFREEGEEVYSSIAKHGEKYYDYIRDNLIKFENDSTYTDILKPILEDSGFVFGEDYDLEYINIFPNAQEPRKTMFYESNPPEGAEYSSNIFDEALGELMANDYNECVTEIILKYYPEAKVVNYGSTCKTGNYAGYTAWGMKLRVSANDSSAIMGNMTSPVIYGKYRNIRSNVPKEYPYDVFKATSFNVMLIEKQFLDSSLMVSAKNNIGTMPWVGLKGWSDWGGLSDPQKGTYHNFRKTDYYEEMIFHIGMTNPAPFQIFDDGSYTTGEDIALLSKIFNQLDEIVGYDDRQAIAPTLKTATKIDQRYLLSGMSAGGRNVWRITPDLYTPGVSIENFKVSDSPLTFKIGNQFVKFPDGSYIYEPEEKLSDYGYWVISPKGTRPTEYRDASLAEPDEPVETADDLPTGYLLEAEGTGKRSDSFDDYSNEQESNGNETDDKENVIVDTDIKKLEVNPINLKGKSIELVSEELPSDAIGHWAEGTLANMFALDILKGDGVGIKPDNNVTMAEYITMLMRLLNVEVEEPEGTVENISDDAWYKNEIYTALCGEWIVSDDVSRVTHPLNREKAVLIFYNAASTLLKSKDSGVVFTDEYRISQGTREAVKAVTKTGIISGFSDGEFKPREFLTRAQSATIFENFLVSIR